VGERGMLLSGGERQRIALARAFLRDAPLLILDEPTSSIDPGTETAILDAMGELMKGRTSFMIAHRPSTLENVDLLMRVEAGRLTVETNKFYAPARDNGQRRSEEIGASNGSRAEAPSRAVAAGERS
jgi:ATP-binding cassette subfamily B protein